MDILDIKINANHRGIPIIREKSHDVLISEIKKQKPKHILEIGTAVGYSAICMLMNSDADLITIENNRELADEAAKNIKDNNMQNRAQIVFSDCVSEIAYMVADEKYNGYFDFIFLDGPKAQYSNMIDGLIMLLKSGGTIIVDDVLFRGYVEKTQKAPTARFRTIIKRLKAFVDNFLSRSDLNNARLIEIEDGLLIAQKR